MATIQPYPSLREKKLHQNFSLPNLYAHEKIYTLIILPVHIMPGNTG